ncbi:hypothetical protein D9615_005457 [Tricholomella constricta]|uniref:Spherulin 4-like cell surface protein n=1 Tax=Tricholomella constricta TaxID=117010 RepID=A0A8H5M5Q2_9AGAR|nr:hypothetical protein D9615_005457 [Tricholomella constricta]
MRLLGALTVLSACVGSLALLPSAVIFPLYIYPGDNCAAWAPLISSISSNPTLQFLFIVNPASGPGAVNSQPDTNYQACVAKLRTTGASSGNNVKIVGYVSTSWGNRASSAVTADIHTYAQWATAYRPSGIFFDEAAIETSALAIYQNYSAHVKTDFGSSAHITLNPGVAPKDNGYFNIADLVVTFEGYFADFNVANLPTSSATPTSKQAVIIHTTPAQFPSSTLSALTKTFKAGATFLTNYENAVAYHNIPTYWTTYLSAVVSSQA